MRCGTPRRSNFVRHALRHTSDRVVVLDKLTYAGSIESLKELEGDARFHFVRGDIADRETAQGVFREHRPTGLVNFAAESHVDRSIDGPREFVQTNTVGAFELLEAARSFLGEETEAVRSRFRFLHVSTDEVYGSLGADGAFCETTPYAPNSPYSASKAAQLRALPVPGEAHPADDPERHRGQGAAHLRGRWQRA
jgi:dTDP-glucose 4,6-dehydratase